MTDQLLTVREVATRLQVREDYVRLQIRAGRLPAVFLSRHTGYRIRPTELARFLAERTTRQQTDIA